MLRSKKKTRKTRNSKNCKKNQKIKKSRLTRGPVEQDALRGLDADRLEQLRVAQRELDQLADLGLFCLKKKRWREKRRKEKKRVSIFFSFSTSTSKNKKKLQFLPYHLLAHAADVVVPDVVQALLVLAPDRLPLAEDLRVRGHDGVRARVRLDDLELDRAHPAADEERVALADGAVGLEEVGLEEGVEEVARDALDGVVDREDVDLLAVLDVGALENFFFWRGFWRSGERKRERERNATTTTTTTTTKTKKKRSEKLKTSIFITHLVHRHHVAQAHPQVSAHHLVDADARLVARVVREDDADGVLALLALEQDGVAAEELEGLHGLEREGDDAGDW